MGDHVLHYFQLPGVKLELIEYKDPQKNIVSHNTDTGIYRHMALTVEDFDSLYSACTSEGVPINLEPSYIEQIDKTVMLIQDPNGVEIEVIKA
jgi:lactoylglutathione lyase